MTQIISLADNTDRTEYTLEPELISNLFDKNREKRRLVKYEDIPPVLVHAVVSAEDKRFFQHSGFDPIRIVKSAYVDVKKGHNAQGASTLSMQLAGMLLLNRSDRSWRRKIPEVLITMHLEQKLKKEQIFEYYANQVPLGQRGSFGIRGFGEAAQAYFGKDISQLKLPEAATLAGLIQQPSYINPFRWPERARQRRNVVLKLMRENNYISDADYQSAIAAPMELAKQGMESTEAPYFVDLVNDTLLEKFPDYNFQSNTYRVYTTLDPNLQHDAAEAVRIGMEEADKRIKGPQEEGSQLSRSAMRFDCAGSADGRSTGADWRQELWDQPTEPHPGQAAAGIVIQAVCLRGGAEHGAFQQRASVYAGHHDHGRADHVLLRREALRAEQFRAQILRQRGIAGCAGAFVECGHGETGRSNRLRRDGGPGAAGGHERGDPSHAGGGAGGL